MTPSFTVLIPARLASTRLPEKPLREIAGRPMILHVVDRARRSGARDVRVATDSLAILAACEAAGVGAMMTRPDHASGSERLAEACEQLALDDDAIVVNVQGDEPLIAPEVITQVAVLLDENRDAHMASLYHSIDDPAQVADPNVVKVVCDSRGRALYFSRAPIPWDRDGMARTGTLVRGAPWRRHIGVYAYRAGFLRRYVSWPPAPEERLEALEQLRALHHGAVIVMGEVSAAPGPGVDTPQDLERVRAIVEGAKSGR